MGQLVHAFQDSLPQDVEAEKALLGSILIDGRVIHRLATKLTPADFYVPQNAAIYAAMLDLAVKGTAVDVVTLTDFLKNHRQTQEWGGVAYLAALATLVPTSMNAFHYATIVIEKSRRRNLIEVGTRLIDGARASDNLAETIASAEQELVGLGTHAAPEEPLTDAIGKTFDRMLSKEPNEDLLPTGLQELDQAINGLAKGDLAVLAALPGTGKTSLVVTVLHQITAELQKPSCFFSLEMTREQIIQKYAVIDSQVPWETVRTKSYSGHERKSLEASRQQMAELAELGILHLVPASGWTAEMIAARARQIHSNNPLRFIAVDYLQRIRVKSPSQNRNLEVGQMVNQMKDLAVELACPVLLISSINRSVHQRGNTGSQEAQDAKAEGKQAKVRPLTMGDLRDSGEIEFTADLILLMWRADAANNVVWPVRMRVEKNRLGPSNIDVLLGMRSSHMEFVRTGRVPF